MKKITLFFLAIYFIISANATAVTPQSSDSYKEKYLPGYFSVGENKHVKFSQGNLQYRASIDTWRFANEQYDIIGQDNNNISSTYDGWIDLFGWGTSGYNEKYPWMISTNELDYGNGANNIAYTEYDWGKHNPIINGGNKAGLWRTLSSEEMNYIFYGRTNADKLYAMCVVNGVHGLVVFPDNCTIPTHIPFTPAYKEFTTEVNNYNLNQWNELEAVGAIFFPAAGMRKGNVTSEVNQNGYYWSTDILLPEGGACEMWFGIQYANYNPGISGAFSRHNGISVRLACDTIVPEEMYVEKNLPGYFSVGENKHVKFSQGNLQYRASTDTWRFANEQYHCVTLEKNKQISQTYNEWIDLLKFASSGYNGLYPWSNTHYSSSDNITDTNYDWGQYNAIKNGGNTAGLWRTMTIDEWRYLFYYRDNASSLFAFATIEDQPGIIVLPDNYTNTTLNTGEAHLDWNSNVLNAEEWQSYENIGGVFLPANGSTLDDLNSTHGFYWSSTVGSYCNDCSDPYGAVAWYFTHNQCRSTDPDNVRGGRSVRLVRDTTVFYNVEVISNDYTQGYTTGSGQYLFGDWITIEAIAYDGYQFAGWNDGNQEHIRTVQVTEDVRYTAYFESKPLYNVEVVSNDYTQGYTTGSGQYLFGDWITIEAIAYDGYRFVQWNDGNKTWYRSVQVTEDIKYIAYFEPKTIDYYIAGSKWSEDQGQYASSNWCDGLFWDPYGCKLDSLGNNLYGKTFTLDEGIYEFKICTDGHWLGNNLNGDVYPCKNSVSFELTPTGSDCRFSIEQSCIVELVFNCVNQIVTITSDDQQATTVNNISSSTSVYSKILHQGTIYILQPNGQWVDMLGRNRKVP